MKIHSIQRPSHVIMSLTGHSNTYYLFHKDYHISSTAKQELDMFLTKNNITIATYILVQANQNEPYEKDK